MTGFSRRAGLMSTVALGAALVLSACGIPLDDAPRAIDRSTTTQPQANPIGTGNGQTMLVYFFSDEQLVDQPVAADDTPTIDEAIKAVLGEPDPPLTTRIPAGTELLGFALEDRTAVIDLSDDIEAFTGPAQKEAYAQLVYTALASGEANAVRFKVAGKVVKAPTDDGNQELVTGDDYQPPLNPR